MTLIEQTRREVLLGRLQDVLEQERLASEAFLEARLETKRDVAKDRKQHEQHSVGAAYDRRVAGKAQGAYGPENDQQPVDDLEHEGSVGSGEE